MSAHRWLRQRVSGAPEPLIAAMLAALPEGLHDVPEALATGALTLYAQVVRGEGTRADAVPLLAADALFTHAFQAQAEIAPERLSDFAARLNARLAEVAA